MTERDILKGLLDAVREYREAEIDLDIHVPSPIRRARRDAAAVDVEHWERKADKVLA